MQQNCSQFARLMQSARAADRSGRLDEADRFCRSALEVDPDSLEALLLAGSIAARQRRIGDGVDFFRHARSVDPDSYDAARWLSGLLMGRDGGKEAVECGRSAVRLRPTSAEAHVILGLAYLASGDPREAIGSFKCAIEFEPKMAGAYHNLGIALHRDEQYEESIVAFKQAIVLAPRTLETYLHLAMVHLTLEQPEAAIDCCLDVLFIEPNSRAASGLLADANFLAIHGERAEEHIRSALEKQPNASFPHNMMGSWLQEQGRFDEASASIERSIELQKVQGFGYFLRAHNRKVVEDDRSYWQEIKKIAINPHLHDSDRRYVNFAIGKAYDDLKEYAEAMVYFDRANGEGEGLSSERPSPASEAYSSRVQSYMNLFSPELLDQHRDCGIPDAKPIFIFGMPRSGTTLLESIISRHSKVGAAGEQSFWRDHRRRVTDARHGTLNEEALRKSALRYVERLGAIAPGKERVTDKFPSNYVHLALLHLAFPNATFIHAKRHPVDTSLSIYMRPFFTVNEFGHTRRNIVAAYRLYLRLMENWFRVLPPGRYLEVQYEDVVNDPETMTRRVIEHCGLEWEDQCLRPEEGERRVRTFSRWQVRQPVYKTSVERWRNYEPWLGVFSELM